MYVAKIKEISRYWRRMRKGGRGELKSRKKSGTLRNWRSIVSRELKVGKDSSKEQSPQVA
jgi:hypothetical protein